MSGKHVAKDQPATFEFDANNQKRIQEILKKIPSRAKKECSYATFRSSAKTA